MKPEEIELIADRTLASAKLLVQSGKALQPLVFFFKGGISVSKVLEMKLGSEEEKIMTEEMIKSIVRMIHAEAVAVVTEAWMVMVKPEDKLKNSKEAWDAAKKMGPPSNHPDRKECILVTVVSPQKGAYRMSEIVRGKDKTTFVDEKTFPEMEVESRWTKNLWRLDA